MNQNIKISPGNRNEISDVVRLMIKSDHRDELWAKHRASKYLLNENKDRLILLARDKNDLIGYAGIVKYDDNPAGDFVNLDDYSWITWIAVLPEYRNKGIGSLLLKFAEQHSKDFMKKGILLDCREKLLPFYERNGYNLIGSYMKDNSKTCVLERLF